MGDELAPGLERLAAHFAMERLLGRVRHHVLLERRLLPERGSAQLAREGFVTRVNSFVSVQVGHVAETFGAVGAVVGPLLAAVARFVNLKGFLVRESFLAHWALEALLVRVGHLVRFEEVLVAESAGANVAQEGFFVRFFILGVGSVVVDTVQGQGFAVDEVAAADFALEYFFLLGVLAAVGPKTFALLETLLARSALVRALVRVQVHVLVEGALVGEGTVAHAAAERFLTRVHSGVGFQHVQVSEGFLADWAHVGTFRVVRL